MTGQLLYPEVPRDRDRWILAQRGPRNPVSPDRPYAFLCEMERFEEGTVGEVATVFLTNRECPWRCVMCDLWRNTLPRPVAPGDIPRQIAYALQHLPAARQVKLYNSGSFFDAGAIPPEDYAPIAALLRGFERVIVECHPALVGPACARFRDLLGVPLEIAMGLESVNPDVLPRLNKRMTLDGYQRAAAALVREGISLRSFVLLQPPFQCRSDAVTWACRAIDVAAGCSATAVAVIPTRGGNGAMEILEAQTQFTPPTLRALEAVLEYGLRAARCRVFADLWDVERLACCAACRTPRQQRLRRMNLSQTLEPPVACGECEGP